MFTTFTMIFTRPYGTG